MLPETSLVAQGLRILLPRQGTWVLSLVQEDLTCCKATKCICHNYWACDPQPPKPLHLERMFHSNGSHHDEKPEHQDEEQSPPAATRQSMNTATKTQGSQTQVNKKFFKRINIKKKNNT